jgi:hypothetical protein
MHLNTLTALGLVVCCSLAVTTVHAQPPKEFKEIDEIAVKLFKAYNKDDAKGVFDDYVEALKGLGDQMWPALFKPSKDKYGNYKSHTFVKKNSQITEEIALYVIEVEFEKEKKVPVGFNLQKEGKNWKIQQVTFNPPLP